MGTLRFGNFEGGSVVDPYRRAITKCSVSEGRWARHVVPLRPGRGPWLPRSRADGVLALERFAMRRMAKRFGAAGARHRKHADYVGVLQAIRRTRAADELVNKTGVETVSGAHQIDRGDGRRKPSNFSAPRRA